MLVSLAALLLALAVMLLIIELSCAVTLLMALLSDACTEGSVAVASWEDKLDTREAAAELRDAT